MGPKLKDYRKRAGFASVDAAAAALGVDRATVYYWEKGDKTPAPERMRRISEVYALSEEEQIDLARLLTFGVTAEAAS